MFVCQCTSFRGGGKKKECLHLNDQICAWKNSIQKCHLVILSIKVENYPHTLLNLQGVSCACTAWKNCSCLLKVCTLYDIIKSLGVHIFQKSLPFIEFLFVGQKCTIDKQLLKTDTNKFTILSCTSKIFLILETMSLASLFTAVVKIRLRCKFTTNLSNMLMIWSLCLAHTDKSNSG